MRSLGYRTDLMSRGFEGEILDRDDYLVIRTPRNPDFYWGNFLLFRNPPKAGDVNLWPALFAREIGTPLGCQHLTFGWDNGEKGLVEPFVAAGFHLMQDAVLCTQNVRPPSRLNTECHLRTLQGVDWKEWVELEQAVNQAQPAEQRHLSPTYEIYLERRAGEYQRLIASGRGEWFGAYVGGRLAAALGLFVWDELARFQMVSTHPDFRRRGLCGTLVYHAAKQGLERMEARTLVMVADPEAVAIKIYESVGFQRSELQWGLGRWPR